MNRIQKYQLIIVGGGIVGLSFAHLMAQAGFKIALIETEAPKLQWPSSVLEARVSAINIASEHVFKEIGVWEELKPHAAIIDQMKIWDSQSGARIEFNSAEIRVNYLGTILENRLMVKTLWERLQAEKKIDFYCPEQAKNLNVDEQCAHLTLESGIELTADLVVGCDGAHSWVRNAMHAGLREVPYKQKAIVAVVQSEEVHQHTAWQNFLSTGPLALLPLKNTHQSALVWSCDLAFADQVMNYSESEFNRALSNASELCLGKLTVLTKPRAILLNMRHAKTYVKSRIALMGDAAHTIHPLAGQGVNLGLMDVRCLAKVLKEAHIKEKDLGAYRILRPYERERKPENEIMIKSMGAFKSLFSFTAPLCVQVRGFGIQFVNQATWLKNKMAAYAMGLDTSKIL